MQFDYFCRMQLDFSLQQINDIAHRLISHWETPRTVALSGGMGAGKTTLVHALCEALSVKGAVGSPTFSIINEYVSEGQPVFHIDCYRLKDEEEAIDAGVEECLYSGSWCFVEWPEKIPHLLPPGVETLQLTLVDGNTRRLNLNSGFNL
ncbi:tRNA threonylcarbamoyladenosine biosynthesis protein TsaE [Flavihumibacter petaseus NBRC 106054]|uniref:tRNA threonylcarbamoyladenosine biosynthesis protein TsaE n=1 Tax=Flavihumibacter petaseus NBRC 106054 TaxID=1220578 RepID=A0A0E9N4Z3_9BACT|nr:tRNA threonylcarbamoyladenosine biosynthesis protein TsaE [Flavihumibacter petaseus NBRC 106054]